MIEVIQIVDKFQPGWIYSEESHFTALDGLRWKFHNRPPLWRPPMDIYETENALFVRLEIAGMQEKDFKLTQKGRFLSIAGFRTDVMERRAFHQMEIPFGEFVIELELPVQVDEKRIEASYLQGFLKVTLPKVLPPQIQMEDNK